MYPEDIENVKAIDKANGKSVMLVADEGYYIHLPEHSDFDYKPVVVLVKDYDFSQVKVVPESELPLEFFEEDIDNG